MTLGLGPRVINLMKFLQQPSQQASSIVNSVSSGLHDRSLTACRQEKVKETRFSESSGLVQKIFAEYGLDKSNKNVLNKTQQIICETHTLFLYKPTCAQRPEEFLSEQDRKHANNKKFSIFLRRDSIVGTRVSTDGRGVVLNFTVGRSNFTKIIFEISLVYDHFEALLFTIIYILSYAYSAVIAFTRRTTIQRL